MICIILLAVVHSERYRQPHQENSLWDVFLWHFMEHRPAASFLCAFFLSSEGNSVEQFASFSYQWFILKGKGSYTRITVEFVTVALYVRQTSPFHPPPFFMCWITLLVCPLQKYGLLSLEQVNFHSMVLPISYHSLSLNSIPVNTVCLFLCH